MIAVANKPKPGEKDADLFDDSADNAGSGGGGATPTKSKPPSGWFDAFWS
jgi:hypothetical protein